MADILQRNLKEFCTICNVIISCVHIHPPESLSPIGFFRCTFWAYNLVFYQNITELYTLFLNKVLCRAINYILHTKHFTKICQLEQNYILINYK